VDGVSAAAAAGAVDAAAGEEEGGLGFVAGAPGFGRCPSFLGPMSPNSVVYWSRMSTSLPRNSLRSRFTRRLTWAAPSLKGWPGSARTATAQMCLGCVTRGRVCELKEGGLVVTIWRENLHAKSDCRPTKCVATHHVCSESMRPHCCG